MLADWLIQFLPPHRVYVEPYGGAASVLLRKPKSYAEVYNDLDDEVVTLFRVLRDPVSAAELIRLLELTPFARTEFERAYEVAGSPIEDARRLIVRSFMGFGSDAPNREVKTGFRASSSRSGTTPAHDWRNYPVACRAIVDRLRDVIIEHKAALDVMKQHDGRDTLFFLDPPYFPTTRSTKARRGGARYHAYRHEMSEDDHCHMLEQMLALKGMVVICGYPCEEYDAIIGGWERHERPALADGARERTEVVWLNHAAARALQRPRAMKAML